MLHSLVAPGGPADLEDDSGYSVEGLRELMRLDLASHGLQSAVAGQESLFQLPPETYILIFNDLSWLVDNGIHDALEDVVMVSAH